MKAIEFVTQLAAISPSREFYLSEGYDEDEIEISLSPYHLQSKKGFIEYGNEILNLVRNFDVAHLALGHFEFHPDEALAHNLNAFASTVSEKLVLDLSNGLIKEYTTSDGIDYQFYRSVAVDGEKFLDCLLRMADVYSKLSLRQSARRDDGKPIWDFDWSSLAGAWEANNFFHEICAPIEL